jgi:hypothetical protein
MDSPDLASSRAVLIGTSIYSGRLPELPAVEANLVALSECMRDPAIWGLAEANCQVIANANSSIVFFRKF